jgi:WD40-like Beta Propeller Repeat
MKTTIIFLLFATLSFPSVTQPRSTRKLPNPVNQPGYNAFAPYISFDGSSLVFLNDYTDDGTLALQYSKRTGADWSSPVAQPRSFSSMLTFIRGFTLSPDGQTLFITSQLSNGVGGFDIYRCPLKGSTFATPVNIGMPVNSKGHEGSPTITADGSTLYFMRCDKMSSAQAEGCKIMMSKSLPGGRWSEAQELPAHINTGNSQTPRIMADGETLLFASNKLPANKGGMDVYETRWNGQTWSQPVALDFVNTSLDDQFVSATAQGQYLLRETKGDRKSELVEYLFPAVVKPKAMMRVDGQLQDATIPAYVSVMNVTNNTRMFSSRPMPDGSFTIFLPEGAAYEIAVEPESGDVTFSTRYFDLQKGVVRPFEKYTALLKKAEVNDEIELSIQFKPYSTEIENTSQHDLRRVSRLLKSTPSLKAEVQVLLMGYAEDSVKSTPDLTEVTIDSVEYYIEDIDSLGQLYQRDTLVAEYRYHNNRTQQQAEKVVEQLVSLGCDRSAFSYFTNARPEAILENRKTQVRIVLRKK